MSYIEEHRDIFFGGKIVFQIYGANQRISMFSFTFNTHKKLVDLVIATIKLLH